MRPRSAALGSCILAGSCLIAVILMRLGTQVPDVPTTLQVTPEAPAPEPVIEVLPPLPEIDPPPPPAAAPIPTPPEETIQKPAEPACRPHPVYRQPCPVYCQPRGWFRRCR